ncbi:MAG: peptide ABC transporter substrate-binding protein [Chloroflexi bacterium]|nr:peptide ABC transporter substrate-binding protein [Chloroflexota bacterium]
MKRIVAIIIAVLLVASLFIAGCPQPEIPTETPTTPAAEGGVLNLYSIDPITLDPAGSNEATSHQYIAQIFSGLVRFDENLEPVPDIASGWEISPDGRTYTFTLRKDVKFHNGRGVKSQDFKYSWERASDPATGSPTAATYLGDIVGVKEKLGGVAAEVSGVKVVDDYTLQVTIDAPKAYFLSKLTYPTSFVVDRENVESGRGWWRTPNGTGPFKLAEWTENQQLVLERNDLYYGEKAKLGSVVFKLWGGVPMDMYETGEIDVAGVHIGYIDKVTDEAGPFYRELAITPELSFSYIGFNHTKPPFDDVNIRLAFSYAVNKNKLISLMFRDMVERADGILPPGMPGYNENLVGLGYDINKAKELIKASKYGDVSNLPPITITVSGWGGLISSDLEAIIYEWRQNLGVEVKVRQLEPERYYYYLMEEKDEMFEMGWIADYPHPQDFLDILFHSGSDNNYGEYSNAELDVMLDTAATEPASEGLALYQQAEEMLMNDAAVIPLWFGQNYTLVKPYVQGYKLNPMGLAELSKVTVQPH